MKTLRLIPLIVVSVVLLLTRPTRGDEVPMTLDECLRRALASALEIREGRYVPAIAETLVSEAESEFEPLFSFRTSGGKAQVPSATLFNDDETEEQTFAAQAALEKKLRTGGVFSFGYQTDDLLTTSGFYRIRPAWTNALSFRFDQPLLRYGGATYNEAATRIAVSGERAARAGFRGVVMGTLGYVEQAYWRLVYARSNLEVKRHSVRVAEELVRVSRRRLDAGAGTRIEVVQAEAGLAEREKELIIAEHLVSASEDTLRSFVYPFAEEPERELRIVPQDSVVTAAGPPPGALGDQIRTAFEKRPDVEAAREELEAAGIRVVMRENELLPRVDTFARVGLAGLDESFSEAARLSLSRRHPAWEVGVALEIPLGNEGARARHRRAVLERGRATAGFETLKNQVLVEVRDALRAVDTSRKEIEATRRAVEAAEAQFEAEKDRVAAEKSTNYQLLEVEQDLSTARSHALLALVEYRNALVALEEATGNYLEWRGLAVPEGAGLADGEAGGAR